MKTPNPNSLSSSNDAVMRLRFPELERVYKGDMAPVDVNAMIKQIPGASVIEANDTCSVVLVRGRKGLIEKLRKVFGSLYDVTPQSAYIQMNGQL